MNNFQLIIGPRCDLPVAHTKYGADVVISIFESFDFMKNEDPTPEGIIKTLHHRFYFDDLNAKSRGQSNAPKESDVRNILALLPFLKDRKVYIHCFAGVSRSTASAYALYCAMLGPGKEKEAIELVESSAPYGGIWPNDLITEYADEILERKGAMIKALKEWKTVELAKYDKDDFRVEVSSPVE